MKLVSGTNEYFRIHYWVAKKLGKPRQCAKCLTKDSKRYEWANISGQYKKRLNDWIRLCTKCHTKMDFFKTHCPQGHKYTPENTYTRPCGWRECRICRKIQKLNFDNRRREQRTK